jgi:hypothetical protein
LRSLSNSPQTKTDADLLRSIGKIVDAVMEGVR